MKCNLTCSRRYDSLSHSSSLLCSSAWRLGSDNTGNSHNYLATLPHVASTAPVCIRWRTADAERSTARWLPIHGSVSLQHREALPWMCVLCYTFKGLRCFVWWFWTISEVTAHLQYPKHPGKHKHERHFPAPALRNHEYRFGLETPSPKNRPVPV